VRIEDRSQANELRFVLLHHLMPAHAERKSHWDLMLEQGEVLLTLALQALPQSLPPGATAVIEAQRLPDHRRYYLDFEGEVSGGRGTVRREAAGRLDFATPTGGGDVTRCRMNSERLTAEIEFPACAPGESTPLTILAWNWE
jgi:hypothetical protein